MLAKAFPASADQIRQSFAGLAMLGDNPTLPLKISKGARDARLHPARQTAAAV